MEMQASRQLSVTQQQAWDALNDPEVLKVCIPGCNSIEPTGENQYAIALSVKIGPVSAKFNGTITLADIQAPESYTLSFEGKGGAAGFGKGNAKVTLTPNDQGCELGYTVQASVGGKIAQMGQRLIDGTAKSMADDFFKRFDQEMQRQYGSAHAEESASDAALSGTAPDTPEQTSAGTHANPPAPGASSSHTSTATGGAAHGAQTGQNVSATPAAAADVRAATSTAQADTNSGKEKASGKMPPWVWAAIAAAVVVVLMSSN